MGHSSSPDDSAINAQIAQNQSELQARRENLMQTRMGIIKASGGQNWDPNIPVSPIINNNPSVMPANGGGNIPNFGPGPGK